MKKLFLLTMGLLCTLFMCAQVSNDNEDGVYKIGNSAIKYRQGEVIVKFKPSSSANVRMRGAKAVTGVGKIDEAFSALDVTEVEELMPQTAKKNVGKKVKSFNGQSIEVKDLSKLYKLKFEESNTRSVNDIVESLRELEDVEFAEPNYIVYVQSDGSDGISYDDPLYSSQWNIPAVNLDKLWAMPKITSKRPVIAILDTGVDIQHPDLVANIWTNVREHEGQNTYDDDGNGFKDDVHGWDFVNQTPNIRDNNGHGTHCAGIAGAVGNNGIGIVGANPDALIMPVTVMQSDGLGDIATIIKGIDYATANGADVINMSFGTYSHSIALEQALANSYMHSTLVAAAGNNNYCIYENHHQLLKPGPMYPAAFGFVLGVEATTQSRTRASFSNWDCDGPISTLYSENLYNYEVSAPGVNIISTFPNGKYKEMSGTSASSPLVAGAISRLITSKQYESNEELFDDLIHSCYNYNRNNVGEIDVISAYNISEQSRLPELELITYRFVEVDGDGDDRIDAGETIEFYPTIRNYSGYAQNIKYQICLGENEDPSIVSILDGETEFGWNLNSYGKAEARNPFKIRINKDCVDGRHICLSLKGHCDNVLSDLVYDFTISVENGIELGGILAENMVLYPNHHYIVTSNLGIPEGVTLTIKPGAILKFKDGTCINNYGIISAEGTKDSLIIITKDELSKGNVGQMNFGNGNFSYVKLTNLVSDFPFVRGSWTNCIFSNLGLGGISLLGYEANVSMSHFYNIECVVGQNSIHEHKYAFNGNYNNIIHNSYDCSFDIEKVNYDNVFGNNGTVNYRSDSPKVLTLSSLPYLGSSIEQNVRKEIGDFYSGFYWGMVDLSNLREKPFEEAHGIVWKVLVNGTDSQDEFDELPPLGVGRHRFDVYFNRPMNKNVAPVISMGVRSPYTQTAIAENGKWNTAGDIYTAYLTITGKSSFDGLNRIRVYGAQDDENFEIPEESSRFNVMVQKAGSMSTGLMAEAGLGKVKLTWETAGSDFADLMGYNVYRFEENQDTTMINNSLIESNETEFVDYDVIPGTTYYYMVKEIGTDLQQHDISNVVSATPLTAQKGDANGSMTVDVADVVTEVAYLTNQNPQPFIFEAADVNEDNTVNILDVVGTVNIIMTPEGVGTASVDNTATFTVEDGILYVDATTPLGGVQISINTPDDTHFEILDGLNGMEQTGAWLNDDEYMLLAYSMSGKTIGIGKQPLMRIGEAEVKNFVASDARGKNVIAINGTATSIEEIPFGIEQSGNAEVRYYDITGRSVSASAAKKSGLYIQSIYVNGKCVKSYKMLNK